MGYSGKVSRFGVTAFTEEGPYWRQCCSGQDNTTGEVSAEYCDNWQVGHTPRDTAVPRLVALRLRQVCVF